jgi:hypothetical protein
MMRKCRGWDSRARGNRNARQEEWVGKCEMIIIVYFLPSPLLS